MTNSTKNNRSNRIAFAHVELVMDFTSLDEAMKYEAANQRKGWLFKKPYLIDSGDGYTVSMTVKRPYNNYNPGW